MKIVNLTPHDIVILNMTNVIFSDKGMIADPSVVEVKVTIPPAVDLPLPRVERTAQYIEMLHIEELLDANIPVSRGTGCVVTNLPEKEEGTVYLVSGIVLEAVKKLGRQDFLAPNELVRDKDHPGVVLGALSLIS